MSEFLVGIATCASWGVAAFFFRFWTDTRDRFFALFATADQREGMRAFIDKRPPAWTGR